MTWSSQNRTGTTGRIAIAGAGLIGLGCAFELASRGYQITLVDPESPQASVSWAAAGMIAPAYEMMAHGEAPLGDLCFESAALWQGFARRVREVSGYPLGFNTSPTLALARTAEERARLDRLSGMLERRNAPVRRLVAEDVQARHGLSDAVIDAIELPSDLQVDNRRLMRALQLAISRLGGRFVHAAVATRDDVREAVGFDPDHIVWARGLTEFGVTGGVKGEALSVTPIANTPVQVFRFGTGYIVPKPDRIVIGATSEADYRYSGVSPSVSRRLFEAACEVMPRLSGASILERWAGIRPKSANGAPLIGPVGARDLVAAAHYRNGVLLTPVTAHLIADMVEGKPVPEGVSAFLPRRAQTAAS